MSLKYKLNEKKAKDKIIIENINSIKEKDFDISNFHSFNKADLFKISFTLEDTKL